MEGKNYRCSKVAFYKAVKLKGNYLREIKATSIIRQELAITVNSFQIFC